jgi:hypothetical protein
MIQPAALRRSHKVRQGYLSLEPAAPGVLFFLGALFITMAVMAAVVFGL